MHLSPPIALIISMVARSISAMQSHRMLPCGVRSKLRALADAEGRHAW